MDADELRELALKVNNYKTVKDITFSDFCKLAGISQKELVNLQIGDYINVSEDVVKRVEGVVNG